MRSDRNRLEDILLSINKIQQAIPPNEAAFKQDEMLQVWFIHHFQIIGEAANKLDRTTREKASDIPWAQIIAMRNILVHAYFGINTDIVWSTAIQFLPQLKKEIEKLLSQIE